MLVRPQHTAVHETPNAVMTVFAAPSLGSRELAAWRVEMRPGQAGPEHVSDREQVWLVLEGAAEVELDGERLSAAAGDALVLPAGAPRRIQTPEGLTAIVSTGAGAEVSTEAQGTRPLPWAA
jgi:quercetin dioxygenase-like cupin family protein